MKTIILAIIIGCLVSTNTWAEHEADHRYNIRGYVLDKNQQGISDLNVQVFSDGSLLGSSKTEFGGYYSIHLHLHNSDKGRILILRAGPYESELRVAFDPGDISTQRVHEANFVAGKYVEGALGRFRIPPWLYVIGGLLALGVIVVILERRRKRKIRQKMVVSSEKRPPGKHKSKRKRRKNR
jgi:hypothetical protein